MTPEEIAKPGTEHCHQAALFAWAALSGLPELKWMHAIPNGGSRGDTERTALIIGGKLKAEGVKPGVYDVFLPVARHNCHGLYIEMKKPGKGKESDKQKEFARDMRENGFGTVVCYSWIEARDVLIQYLKKTEINPWQKMHGWTMT